MADLALPPIPLNLVTRGNLAGQYAILTRGYIACPDVVPRYPAIGIITDADLAGLLFEGAGLEGTLMESLDAMVGQVAEDEAFALDGELSVLEDLLVGLVTEKPGEGRH